MKVYTSIFNVLARKVKKHAQIYDLSNFIKLWNHPIKVTFFFLMNERWLKLTKSHYVKEDRFKL